MQSGRANKRRKLDQDEPPRSSPASRQSLASKKGRQARSSPAVNGTARNGAGNTHEESEEVDDDDAGVEPARPSASDLWFQAKRKAKAQGRKPDIYDDIDGANVGREPYGSIKAAKPARPASKPKAAPLNFFKQFAKGKVDATTKPGVKKAVVVVDEEEDEEEESSDVESDELQSSRNGRNWTMEKPGQAKKTFEDEIRDLEEAARKQAAAEDGDSEDELANDGELRRSSARSTSIRKPVLRQQNGQNGVSSPAAKAARPQPLDRRKLNRIELEETASDDEMEIDDSEDERLVASARAKFPVQVQVKEVSNPKRPKAQPPAKTVNISLPPFQEHHLRSIQKILLEKCSGKRPIPLANLADEYAKVSSLISQTITAGESNSMLLIGARGSGKTALLNQILREQSVKHPDDYHVVRLNGFIHTDDKIALREIWRQLGREMEIEDNEASKNYADTLTTLLALLSHPAETGRDEEGQVTKSVIFILDEFELFATHPRQTLLYNLFDIAQSRKAPIAVLGCTTRIDVAESLEKRVKSRFSHRYVHLGLSKSLQAFEQVCRCVMRINMEELEGDEQTELGLAVNGIVAKLQKAALSSVGKKDEGDEHVAGNVLEHWNTLVDAVVSSEPCRLFLKRLYHTTKSVSEFMSSLMLAIATLPISAACTSSALLEHLITTITAHALQAPDSKLSILESLSSLQLALLICAARLTNIYNSEIISFALAYEEYKNLASKAKLQASASGALAQGAGSRVWGKGVAKGAWEGLVEYGLILEDGRGGRVDVGMEEIGGCGVELGSWGRWCREI